MSTIMLTKGYVAVVDDDDYEMLSQWSWCAVNTGGHVRAFRIQRGVGPIYMHRLIMRAGVGQNVDHINRDALDNRKINLRICSHAENLCNQKIAKNNTSGFKGVRAAKKKYRAVIGYLGKIIELGTFGTAKEAALAYDAAARKYHGIYASPNFPEG